MNNDERRRLERSDVRDFLEKSLDRVNYWLQFAETKHAALIAFLVAVLAVLHSGDFINLYIFKLIMTIIYLGALVISIISFFPRYDKDTSRSTGMYKNNDNLLFWKDIAKYSEHDFLKKMYKDFFEKEKQNFDKEEKQYVEEIIINARIAKYKFDLFRTATIVVVVGISLMALFLVLDFLL